MVCLRWIQIFQDLSSRRRLPTSSGAPAYGAPTPTENTSTKQKGYFGIHQPVRNQTPAHGRHHTWCQVSLANSIEGQSLGVEASCQPAVWVPIARMALTLRHHRPSTITIASSRAQIFHAPPFFQSLQDDLALRDHYNVAVKFVDRVLVQIANWRAQVHAEVDGTPETAPLPPLSAKGTSLAEGVACGGALVLSRATCGVHGLPIPLSPARHTAQPQAVSWPTET